MKIEDVVLIVCWFDLPAIQAEVGFIAEYNQNFKFTTGYQDLS